MSIWLQGWQVGLIGLLVVFAGLVLFIGLKNQLKSINSKKSESRQGEEQGFALDLPAPVAESDIQQTVDDQAIAAAITAAVQSMLGAEAEAPRGFVVRRIRRIA